MLDYDSTSSIVHVSPQERLGFCTGYEIRRHKNESEANRAIHRARQDWLRYIGPTTTFANANPYHGNFASLVLPFTLPERVAISAYFLEYAFLYDDICESANKSLTMDPDSDGLVLSDPDTVLGAKQIQAKIILDLYDIDRPCGQRIIDMWKKGMSTTRQLKLRRPYTTLDEYIPFRSLDTGAPFVLAIMLFGIGIYLTDEDLLELEDIVSPAYAALGLANDYFSFDREYAEHHASSVKSGDHAMTNAVWLCMQWSKLDVAQAKEMVRTKTLYYESEYIARKTRFLDASSRPEKLRLCLDGLSQMISGNVTWSLTCPRYHTNLRYDANAGVENEFLDVQMPSAKDLRSACTKARSTDNVCQLSAGNVHTTLPLYYKDTSSPGSAPATTEAGVQGCSVPSAHASKEISCERDRRKAAYPDERSSVLLKAIVSAPFEYCARNPSQNVRASLIDALNVWIGAPVSCSKIVSSIAGTLHNASLLLDDIEDASPLRRGKPSAHMIFGVPSTINSANFAILKATEQARGLGLEALDLYLAHMRDLFIGQSYDLYWTHHTQCPSIDEYLSMVDGKTGGLFQLLYDLLVSKGTNPRISSFRKELQTLLSLFGRLYQIRDDFKNLTCLHYANLKGLCEDLDEGKYSYPIIEALSLENDQAYTLQSILIARRKGGKLTSEMKEIALHILEDSGALKRTEDAVVELHVKINEQLDKVEDLACQRNWVLRLLLQKISLE